MIKAVLDTNILVSAFIKPGGNQYYLIEKAARREFLLILSPAILEELNRTLHYARLRKKYNYAEAQIFAYIAHLASIAEIASDDIKMSVIKEDPDDDMVLATGVSGNVNYIVSGDSHLKNLEKYQKIKIISPAEFLIILSSV